MNTRVVYQVTPEPWVTVELYAALSGLSEGAIRKRLERGLWLENKHWRKAPDNRVYICRQAVCRWIEGKE